MKNKSVYLFALTSTILASCGGNSSEQTITLTVWEDVNNIPMLETLATQFLADYANTYPSAPAIDIVFVEEKEAKAVSDLSLDGPSGNGPDLFAFVHDTLSSAVSNDLIAPNMYHQETKASHLEESVKAFTYQNILYGYPITSESITLMYDKSKLSENDVSSMENLLASGQKVVWDVANTDSSAYYAFGVMNDVNLFGNGTQANQLNLATPKAVANMTALSTTYKNMITNATPDSALTIMQAGEAAAVISSPYLWSSVKAQLGNNAGIATLPTINGDAQRPFSGYKGYGVSRYSKNPHIAHAFASYLVGETAQRYRFIQKGILPTYAISDIINTQVNHDAVANVFKASLAQSLTMPNIIAMGSFWAPMNDAVTEIYNLGNTATSNAVNTILTNATNTIKTNI